MSTPSLLSVAFGLSNLPFWDWFCAKKISNCCESIDPDWCKELLDPDKPQESVKDRLNKLSIRTIKCGALLFPQVVTSPLCIGNNPKYMDSKEKMIPLSQKEIEFYLSYENKIYHIQMSSTSDVIALLPVPEKNSPYQWETSISKIKDMAQKDWSNCFVTACYTWDLVVPVPTVVAVFEKITYNQKS